MGERVWEGNLARVAAGPWLGAGWQMGRQKKMFGTSHYSARNECKGMHFSKNDGQTFKLV